LATDGLLFATLKSHSFIGPNDQSDPAVEVVLPPVTGSRRYHVSNWHLMDAAA